MDNQKPMPAAPAFGYSPNKHSSLASGQPVIVTAVVPVGPEATRMTCPYCNSEIDSSIRREPGLIAWISGGVLLLLGCFLGCCLIPCCVPECMNVHHNCPNCKAYLGRYSHC